MDDRGTDGDSLHLEVRELLRRARSAGPALATATSAQKDAFLDRAAALLTAQAELIAEANQLDLQEARLAGRAESALDRLRLDRSRVLALAAAVRDIIALPDPVGQITSGTVRPNGLEVRKQRVPLGVIGIVYEARPNVTVDAAALACKAGNVVILRGGSESRHTNAVLVALMRDSLQHAGLPIDAVQAPQSTDHRLVEVLVSTLPGLDLVIPRGGTGLIEAVTRAARVPVIQHYQGVCHVYVDAQADLDTAEQIVLNAKTQRPGVCNAMECLLIDAAIADQTVARFARSLADAGVEVRACARALPLTSGRAIAAQERDFGCEFLSMTCALRVVDGVAGALDHIGRYGSRHTEVIVTRDIETARHFVAGVDASCVLVNASTRFNDGGCLGLGAEIGISTTKLHAYGPMGLQALTTERYVVYGQGQVRT